MDRRQQALEARGQARARVAVAAETVMKKITIPTADVTKQLSMSGEAIAGHIRDFMSPRVSR